MKRGISKKVLVRKRQCALADSVGKAEGKSQPLNELQVSSSDNLRG